MTDFRDFYSAADLADYTTKQNAWSVAREAKLPEADAFSKAWLESLHSCEDAIYTFLSTKAAARELDPIPFVEGRKLRYADAWQSFIDGELDPKIGRATLTDGCALFPLSLATGERKDGVQIAPDVQYEDFVERINSGKHVKPSSSYSTCNLTGDTLYVDIDDGWKVRYGYQKKEGFIPLQDEAPAERVQHTKVVLPSGELLVSDWAEIKGFRDLVAPNSYVSLETDAGCAKYANHYAKNHGFLWVQVGDAMPSLIERDGQHILACPRFDEDLDDLAAVRGKNLGQLDSFRWSATAIDRETLTSILEKDGGRAAAEDKVARWIAEGESVLSVKFPPGTELNFYQAGERGLQGRFQSPTIDMSDVETLFGVFSTGELDWEPIAAPKQKVRP